MSNFLHPFTSSLIVVGFARSAIFYLLVLLSSCKTLDESLKQVDNVINDSTVKSITGIISSDNPGEALKRSAEERAEYYKKHPDAISKDIQAVQRQYSRLLALLQGKAEAKWGKEEVKVPTQKEYVKYTQNYLSRAVVDFDKGELMIETLDQQNTAESLRNAIVTTLLTPDDPRSVDLYSDKPVQLSSKHQPYLKDLVLDQHQKSITDIKQAESFANYLINNKQQSRTVKAQGKTTLASYVNIQMVRDFNHKQAKKYTPLVKQYASRYDISPSLVLAVIRTESNFNPFAVSSAPAYGLMQLVPTSGGRDAYRRVTGKDSIPSKEYLFEANNNIELGTAYINLLSFNYLKQIKNPVSREYCVISAYNTGTGNVLKTFSPRQSDAIKRINQKSPADVYAQLRSSLPYAETRRYLEKVTTYRKQFISAVN